MSFGIAPHEMAEEIEATGSWPYNEPQRHWHNDGGGDWSLWMSRSAAIVVWPHGDRTPDAKGYIRVCDCTKEQADRFIGTFCMQGYEEEPWMVHQNGRVWLFNWRSYNFAQIEKASQVAEALFDTETDRYNEAWSIGKAYGEQIDAAVQERYREEQGAGNA